MDIIAQGNHIVITVNGTTTVDYVDSERHFTAGYIGLQLHNPQTVVEFNSIEIKELSDATTTPGTPSGTQTSQQPADSSESIFNGTDLSGWQGDERIWMVEEGTIVGHGERNPSHDWKGNTYLIHQKDYADFELTLQFKLSNLGNSGVQFRSFLNAEGKMQGYQAEIGYARNRETLTGDLQEEATGRGFLKKLDEQERVQFATKYRVADWNDLYIQCVGDHVVIKINGFTTVDFHDPPGRRSGFFALQSHGGIKPEIAFRNIRVRDLSHP